MEFLGLIVAIMLLTQCLVIQEQCVSDDLTTVHNTLIRLCSKIIRYDLRTLLYYITQTFFICGNISFCRIALVVGCHTSLTRFQ